MRTLFAGSWIPCQMRRSQPRPVSLSDNPCGSALGISDSNGVTVRTSSFEDNGSLVGFSDRVGISPSQRVRAHDIVFITSSRFDVNLRACDDCQVIENTAWHPRHSGSVVVARFRIVSGSSSVSRNFVDSNGCGCKRCLTLRER